MSDRLRVCLVSAAYYPYPSGVSEHVHHLAIALRDLGQEVEILTTRYPARTEVPEPVPVTRVGRAVLVPMNRSYATLPVGLRMAGQVKRFLAPGRFDVVHCHGFGWPELSYWATVHSRSVTLVSLLTAGFRITTAGGGLFRRLFGHQLRRIDALVPISRRALDAVRAYLPIRARIIPSGVDLDRFRPGLEPLPAPGPGPRILFLGRLDRRKGVDVAIRALAAVRRRLPGAVMTVVGSGPEEGRARRLVAGLGLAGAVTFTGRAGWDELPRYYTGCDVYCAPTLGGETLGIVLLEAMAAGAPVVASRIPGYDETVRDGTDGLLAPPGDPDALAAAIARVLTDEPLRRRLRASGLARARDYAWPEIGRRTLDFYRELLQERRQA